MPWKKINKSSPTLRNINPFWQLLSKGEDLPFGKESLFPFRKNHPPLEDTKFKLLLCMSLVFVALRNISFNDDNHIMKFFTEGFENLLSSFFYSKNLLSSIGQSTWLHLYFPFRKFHLVIHNKIADNNGTALQYETNFDISARTVSVELIYLSGDLKTINLPYQFVILLLKVEICSACKCNYLQT